MSSERRSSGEAPSYMTLQRHGAIRRKSSSQLPEFRQPSPRVSRQNSAASSSSNRSELTGDRVDKMAAKNSRDLEHMKAFICQASQMKYESEEAKALYKQANRLVAAVRERQALMDCIQADNEPTHKSCSVPEVAEGVDSQPQDVVHGRKHKLSGRSYGRHQVRSRSRDRNQGPSQNRG